MTRGRGRSELAIGVDQDGDRIVRSGGHAADADNEGPRLCGGLADAYRVCLSARTEAANVNVVVSRRQTATSAITQANIVAAGVVELEREIAAGRVVAADRVVMQCEVATGHVATSDGVAGERALPKSCVVDAGGIGGE